MWDLSVLKYGWLTDQYLDDLISVPYKSICRNYLIDEYLEDASQVCLKKAVHIQAALDHPDPVEETAWLQAEADRTGFPQGIIAFCDLRDKNAERELERHAQYKNFRGIRMLRVDEDLCRDVNFHKGLGLVEKNGWIYDLDIQWPQMVTAYQLAKQFPDMFFLLNHAGFPTERSAAYYEEWKNGMRKLAQAENVICKISGLGMYDPKWTTESIRSWVEECIEIFGVEKCMFATNWPLDSLFSTYDELIVAYQEIVNNYSVDEQQQLFSLNAIKYYEL